MVNTVLSFLRLISQLVSIPVCFPSLHLKNITGHTYERAAIERWIRSNPSESGFIMSPLNGSRIEQTILSNLTMKKLIQDLINEGGAGLYTTDTSDGDRLFAVRPERILGNDHINYCTLLVLYA